MERMKMWLCDRSNAILVTDLANNRGWEDSCIIAVVGGYGIDVGNICMRAVANMSLVKETVKSLSDRNADIWQ